MYASAWNVDVLVYSDVFLSRKSYMYKCVQSVKQDPSEFVCSLRGC